MIVYIKNFLKFIILLIVLLQLNSIQAQDFVVPRPIVEWCLECQSTVKILYKQAEKQDSVIVDLKEKNKEKDLLLTSYKKEAVLFNEKIDRLYKVISNDDKVIIIQDKTIKKLKISKWVERGIGVIILVSTIIIMK